MRLYLTFEADHGDDGSAGGGMMFKEIHEQIRVRMCGARVVARADCCFVQLLGSSTPQTVLPLLMGRSSSTAVMRSRYMSRDAGPSTQAQVHFVFYSGLSVLILC